MGVEHAQVLSADRAKVNRLHRARRAAAGQMAGAHYAEVRGGRQTARVSAIGAERVLPDTLTPFRR